MNVHSVGKAQVNIMTFFIIACISFIVSFGLTNYLSAIVSMKVKQTGSCPEGLRKGVQAGITVAILLPLIVLCIGGLICAFNPAMIYKTLHYLWMTGLVALVLAITTIRAIFLIKSNSYHVRTRSRMSKKAKIIIGVIVGWISLSALTSVVPMIIYNFLEEFIIIAVMAIVIVAISVLTVFLLKRAESSSSLVEERATSRGILLLVGSVLTLGIFVFSIVNIGNVVVQLSDADDFVLMKNMPLAGRGNYLVANDIDFEDKKPEGWGEIKEFTGVFDGGHHTLKNIKFVYDVDKKTNQSIGMVLNNLGDIKNVSIEDSYFDVDIRTDKDKLISYFYFGVLAAQQGGDYKEGGVIDNCRLINVYADIDIYSDSTPQNGSNAFIGCVGGLVGNNSSVISNCEVFTNDSTKNNGLFIDFDVESQTDYRYINVFLGGAVGQNYNGSINNCVIKGLPLDAKSLGDYNYVHVGGLIGDNDGKNEITNCVLDINCLSSVDRAYFWEQLQLGDADAFSGLLIGNQDFNQYNKITSRDNYIVRYPDVNIVGNRSGEDIAGINIVDLKEISLDILPSSYSEWSMTSNGYPTPCKGFRK